MVLVIARPRVSQQPQCPMVYIEAAFQQVTNEALSYKQPFSFLVPIFRWVRSGRLKLLYHV